VGRVLTLPSACRRALVAALAATWMVARASTVLGATYFVDCQSGRDEASGTAPTAAWRSFEAVHRTTFLPGDNIRLRAGCEWIGTLSPRGSGAEGRPITLGPYGDGAGPLINGAGATAALLLTDQDFWEISDLRFTNDAPAPGLRRGGLVRTIATGRVFTHIYLRRLDVRDVRGQLGAEMEAKTTGGIGFETRGTPSAARFDDVRIEDCVIERVDSVGIYL